MNYMVCIPAAQVVSRDNCERIHNILARVSDVYKIEIRPEPVKMKQGPCPDYYKKYRIYKEIKERDGNAEAYLAPDEEEMLLSVCRNEEEIGLMKSCTYAYQYPANLVLKSFRDDKKEKSIRKAGLEAAKAPQPEGGKEPGAENAKESARESSRDNNRDSGRDNTRENSRENTRDNNRDNSRETARDNNRDGHRENARENFREPGRERQREHNPEGGRRDRNRDRNPERSSERNAEKNPESRRERSPEGRGERSLEGRRERGRDRFRREGRHTPKPENTKNDSES